MEGLKIRYKEYSRLDDAQDIAYEKFGDSLGIISSPIRGTLQEYKVDSTSLPRRIDLIEWDARYKDLRAYTRQRGVVFLRRIVRVYYNAVTETTPVDTGNAKSNWYVRDEKEAASRYINRKKLVHMLDKLGGQDESFVKQLNDEQREKIDKMKRSEVFVVENPTPYIQVLDVGYSDQAPQGMSIHGENAVQKAWDRFHSGEKNSSNFESRELGSKR